MSRQSKAKRDQRKKHQAKRPFARLGDQQQVQNHAVLTNEEGQVVAAIGLQGRQWLLSIGGQTMGNADDPMPMLAMLKHLANVQGKEGRTVELQYSEGLAAMLSGLAAEQGLETDAYLDQLAAEFDSVEDGEGESEGAGETVDTEAAATPSAAEPAPAATDADTSTGSDEKPQA